MTRGGGYSKGQTKPYAVVRAWEGGKPARTAHWTLGAAEAGMLDTLRAANWRGSELDIRIINRATGRTVVEPQRCVVCGNRWATETGHARGADAPSLCTECDEDDMPAGEPAVVATPSEVAPLLAALQARGLDPAVRLDGTVTVTANDIDWTMKPVPHAVTGEPCGVWSAVGPVGSRGYFGAASAAEFVAQRRVP